jgi:hypothetical protein
MQSGTNLWTFARNLGFPPKLEDSYCFENYNCHFMFCAFFQYCEVHIIRGGARGHNRYGCPCVGHTNITYIYNVDTKKQATVLHIGLGLFLLK